MSFSALPVELYRLIAAHLELRSDISRFMRTSRIFYRELERILYQEISLVLDRLDLENSVVDQLLLRFKTNSRRCSFVLRLKLFLRLIPTAKLSTITQFLLQLTNLRNLYLKAPNSIIHPLLHGCSFQLQIFKYYNDALPTNSTSIYPYFSPYSFTSNDSRFKISYRAPS